MKKVIALIIVLGVIFLTGCVSQKDHDTIVAEKDVRITNLEDEKSALETEKSDIKDSLTQTETKFNELNDEVHKVDAHAYVLALQYKGFPVDNLQVYNEENDINGLLGRPNEYVSKVNFADTRLTQRSDLSDPVGGIIEVFLTKEDMEKRKLHIETNIDLAPINIAQYIYPANDGLALFRLDYDLTPAQAEEYHQAFQEICEVGVLSFVSQ